MSAAEENPQPLHNTAGGAKRHVSFGGSAAADPEVPHHLHRLPTPIAAPDASAAAEAAEGEQATPLVESPAIARPTDATPAPSPVAAAAAAPPAPPTNPLEVEKAVTQPKSAIKLGTSRQTASAQTVHCAECGVDIPAHEWPNHRDRLRTVHLTGRTKTFVQRYILTPLLNTIMWMLVNVFFREVAVVGTENIPTKGPVVFYGNHQNQFVDAMMMRACCGRPVRFIIAEKSMSRPVIGQFARIMDSVPVIRPQDVPSNPGQGKLVKTEGAVVFGSGTTFNTTIHVGDVILWSAPGVNERCSGQVLTVTSDTELVLTRAVAAEAAITSPVNFKISPRIDHSEMYADVYETLRKGGAIGIFPEGGSHDHTSMIPLKAGVALFTLGAAERGIQVKIVPCGLTYFYGHKFRSRAHIEFGKPLTAPTDLVEMFATDKRTATGNFLKILDRALRAVTINVKDWSTLKLLHNFRRVYQPPGLLLETGEYLALTRRLAVIIEERTGEPDFDDFRDKVENYVDFCNALLVRDSQAATLEKLVGAGQSRVSIRLLFRRICVLCVLTIVLIPFFVVCGPIGVLCHVLAEGHAKSALSSSSVKVVAADVKASFKMVLGFVLVPLTFAAISTLVAFLNDVRHGATVFVSMPVVMYVSLIMVREWVMEGRAALPLIMSILSKHKQFMKLHERRCEVVTQAKQIVVKYDAELDQEVANYRKNMPDVALRQASLFSLRHQSRVEERKKRL